MTKGVGARDRHGSFRLRRVGLTALAAAPLALVSGEPGRSVRGGGEWSRRRAQPPRRERAPAGGREAAAGQGRDAPGVRP